MKTKELILSHIKQSFGSTLKQILHDFPDLNKSDAENAISEMVKEGRIVLKGRYLIKQ